MDIYMDKYNLSKLNEYLIKTSIDRLYIITDEVVNRLYMDYLKSFIGDIDQYVYILPSGEENKTIDNILSIYDDLIEKKHRQKNPNCKFWRRGSRGCGWFCCLYL